ncbi:MAG: EamA family transporter [Gammaproteobacteria bacterium]|nr:EamA family transporter [Gammaproteobacteria bacterium]NVK86742.1 EamA family transporter [Gammaproteobacteria bacterium]
MQWLVVVTIIWAFSFSLIGEVLAGKVDGYIAVAIRMLLALLLFTPWLLRHRVASVVALKLMLIGAIQIGVMYLLFYHSFLFLSVTEVLLFTILTPVYVSIIDDLMYTRQFHLRWLAPAIIAVIGAAVIRYQSVREDFWIGLLLVQGANMCFAFGQVAYKRLLIPATTPQLRVFGYFFLGAAIVTTLSAALLADFAKLPQTLTQWATLLWLGLGASGLGYFLWNYGSRLVNTGQLATMNNALIPAGILVNLVLWQRQVDWLMLTIGSVIILLSVLLSTRSEAKAYTKR